MAKNNNDNNDENKQNDALKAVAENLKNAINELVSKHTDAEGTPVDVEVTVEKDTPQKKKKNLKNLQRKVDGGRTILQAQLSQLSRHFL